MQDYTSLLEWEASSEFYIQLHPHTSASRYSCIHIQLHPHTAASTCNCILIQRHPHTTASTYNCIHIQHSIPYTTLLVVWGVAGSICHAKPYIYSGTLRVRVHLRTWALSSGKQSHLTCLFWELLQKNKYKQSFCCCEWKFWKPVPCWRSGVNLNTSPSHWVPW